jgi:hypothetical protein
MNGVCDIELLSQPQPAISTAAVLLVSPRGTVPRGEISPFAARGVRKGCERRWLEDPSAAACGRLRRYMTLAFLGRRLCRG